ncbi:MAG: hypothetical protein K8J09_19175 [Planctomycetes bacterium]|nr:hypothetical protein [Planctomycetota bacterium]
MVQKVQFNIRLRADLAHRLRLQAKSMHVSLESLVEEMLDAKFGGEGEPARGVIIRGLSTAARLALRSEVTKTLQDCSTPLSPQEIWKLVREKDGFEHVTYAGVYKAIREADAVVRAPGGRYTAHAVDIGIARLRLPGFSAVTRPPVAALVEAGADWPANMEPAPDWRKPAPMTSAEASVGARQSIDE